MIASNLILLQCLYGAALTDLYDRRIPNSMIGIYLLLGIVFNFRSIGYWDGTSPLTFSSPFLFIIYFLLSSLMLSFITVMTNAGAGDAKLMALIISWCGFYRGITLLLPGLILALAFILISKAETEAMKHGFISPISPKSIKSYILKMIHRQSSPTDEVQSSCIIIPQRITLPLAIPVFLGAIPGLIQHCIPI